MQALCVVGLLLNLVPVDAYGARDSVSAERVRQAALDTYIHGMTDEIALREVGRDGIPHLLRLLEEPSFPRRDNVVAFLAHLAGNESSAALLKLLRDPPANRSHPAEDRAALLVPVALGRIAARHQGAALDALNEMNRPDGLDALDPTLKRGLREQISVGLSASAETGAVVESASSRAPDSQTSGHASLLTYANHVDVSSPMTDTRADLILDLASTVAGFADFPDDVTCCIQVKRQGSGASFGQAGDSLDVISNSSELNQVLGNSVARVKVVRVINYCGGPGTNILGCSYVSGNGMAVVRISANEGLLWLHEFGHNVGLSHNPDNDYLMDAGLSSNSVGLTQTECNRFHNPSSSAGVARENLGVCHDNDDDDYASTADNCPNNFNPDQSDSDGDGVGNACNGCIDMDGDGFGSPPGPDCAGGQVEDCDDDNAYINPGAPELCDGQDNNCNGLADFDEDGEVDLDGDRSYSCEDCDDTDRRNFPGHSEQCDGQDNDCDGLADYPGETIDLDADGWPVCSDCDDTDPDRFRGNPEVCDGKDNDCDLVVDNECPPCPDDDLDDFAVCDGFCVPPEGGSCGDCDDTNPSCAGDCLHDLCDPSVDSGSLIRLPDLNGNGTSELAILLTDAVDGESVQIFDPLTGARVDSGAIRPHPGFPALALAALDDGAIAILGVSPSGGLVLAQLRDPLSGAVTSNVFFGSGIVPRAMAVIENHPDASGAVLVLVGVDRLTGAGRVKLRIASNGQNVGDLAIPMPFAPRDVAVVGNYGGTPSPELAVLAEHRDVGLTLVQVRDGSSGDLVRNLFYPSITDARSVAVIDDHPAAAGAVLAVFGTLRSNGSPVIELRDAQTGAFIRNVSTNSAFPALAFSVIPALPGTLASHVAALASTASGLGLVQMRSADDDTVFGNVFYGSAYLVRALAVLEDFAGSAAPELAVLGRAGDSVRIQIRDAGSGAIVGEILP